MKFGLLIDKSAQESFQIRDGKSYLLNSDIPYQTKHSIGHDTHMSIFQYPFLFGDNGYFINLKKTKLPDIAFDIIFLIRERWPEEFTIDKIRNKYPNAKIFGVVKEQWLTIHEEIRCNALIECDEVAVPFKLPIENQPGFITSYLNEVLDKPATWIPQPYDIDFLYNKYYKQERKYDVFSYISPTKPEMRRAETESFTRYMADKYNLSVRRVMTDNWNDFMEEISNCRFLFNLDPTRTAGQTGIQCAIVGVPAIGSNADSNHHLFPNLVGNDFSNLEQQFVSIYEDMNSYIECIQEAFTTAESIYNMKSIKQKIIKLYEK